MTQPDYMVAKPTEARPKYSLIGTTLDPTLQDDQWVKDQMQRPANPKSVLHDFYSDPFLRMTAYRLVFNVHTNVFKCGSILFHPKFISTHVHFTPHFDYQQLLRLRTKTIRFGRQIKFFGQSFKKELSLRDQIFHYGCCEPSPKIEVFRFITHVWSEPHKLDNRH